MSMRPMNAMQAAASSSKKLNAAGLTPDHSLILPERAPAADENEVLQALVEVRGGRRRMMQQQMRSGRGRGRGIPADS